MSMTCFASGSHVTAAVTSRAAGLARIAQPDSNAVARIYGICVDLACDRARSALARRVLWGAGRR